MNDDRIRPPGRDPGDASKIRPPSSREAAAEYARKIIDAGGDDVRDYDDFYIPPHLAPDGWAYEWKRVSVAGKDDGFYQADLQRKGWRPVPAARHPELMPMGWKGGNVEKKGLILMEWPTILVERAKRRDNRDARDAVETAEQRLYATPPATLPREEFPDKMRGVRKTFESGAAPSNST